MNFLSYKQVFHHFIFYRYLKSFRVFDDKIHIFPQHMIIHMKSLRILLLSPLLMIAYSHKISFFKTEACKSMQYCMSALNSRQANK